MYQIGDLVVYGSIGVCRVDGFSHPDGGGSKLFYCLSPLYQPGVIHTPVESEKVPLRSVMTAAAAEALLSQLTTIRVEIYKERTIQQLAQKYQSVLQTGDPLQLLSLSLSVQQKRIQAEAQNRRLGMVDERYGRQAERLLFGELAVALDMSIDDIPHLIFSRLNENA